MNQPEPHHVRTMRPNDAEEVHALIGQLGYSRPLPDVVRWISELSTEAMRQAAFVSAIDLEVVGWIEVSIRRDLQSSPFALIGGLVVKDGFRGCGIGRDLCREAELWTWQQDLLTLRVTSRSTREAAHAFYRSYGYTQHKTSLVFEKHRPATISPS